jgi:hypothetical protein
MMETKVDITERYETGEKMINIAHAFGMIQYNSILFRISQIQYKVTKNTWMWG